MVESDFNYRRYKGVEIRRKDPYGFWYIDTPAFANQSFTSSGLAYQAIDEYLHTQKDNEKRAEKLRK